MSDLTEALNTAGQEHKGTDLGGLLQWAMLHIHSQDEALAEAREELAAEKAGRDAMLRGLQAAHASTSQASKALLAAMPVNIELARDFAPHINRMAAAGVEPYAKKPRNVRPARAHAMGSMVNDGGAV